MLYVKHLLAMCLKVKLFLMYLIFYVGDMVGTRNSDAITVGYFLGTYSVSISREISVF